MAANAPTPRWQRLPGWLTWLSLAIILGHGARLRLQWPLWPLSDSDTWGYLHPALAKLTGDGFQHTYGRNFVYPGWVYLWLRACGDFRAVCLAQHALGLATGAVLWRVWQLWRGWFPQPRLPGWVATAAGLGLVAFYVSSTTVIFLEQRIRPEAVFPFFAILAVYLTLEFLRAWFRTPNTLAAALLAGAIVFDAVFCYQLKPSFGLAAGVALLPLLAAGLQPGQLWQRRLALPGAAGGALLLAALLLFWPEHVLARTDNISDLFLPETLLTLHADVIRDQMAQDLAQGDPTPYAAGFLADLHARLAHELELASVPGQHPYESLGFNPDYLMYEDSFCRYLYHNFGTPFTVRLGFYYFARAWWHQPATMARNVARQLDIFYGRRCPAFWLGRAIDIARNYRKSVAAFEPANDHRAARLYPPAVVYLAAAQSLGATSAVYRQEREFTLANEMAAEVHLPLLAALAAGLALAICLPSVAFRRELAPAGALSMLFFAYAFGNCLTVAIVHSMDIDRYSSNLLIFAILSEMTALVWCVEALLAARYYLNRELPAPPPHGPADDHPTS
jgi:hypothetical protein